MRLEPPSWWYAGQIPAAAWGLLPLSVLYGAIVQARFRAVSPYRSKLPVICVGNFTLGGAGKTPVALKLAALLRGRNRKPGFLTRGYGGRERGPHRVDTAGDCAARVGDEPLLLAEAAATVVSRDRAAGARFAEALGIDTLVMDDGFQNPSLKKDFSLIVIDAEAGLGSGRVFPLGPLRAPINFQAGMADAILVLGERGHGEMALERVRRSVCGSAPSPQPSPQGEREKELGPFHLGEREFGRFLSSRGGGSGGGGLFLEASIAPSITDEMRDRPFLAFCGIGRPAKFFGTLKAAGIAAVNTRSFPDHHRYTEADAQSLLAAAKALHAGLLTTGKDLVRLRGAEGALAELHRSALALPITIEFCGDQEAALMDAILRRIQSF